MKAGHSSQIVMGGGGVFTEDKWKVAVAVNVIN